MEEQSRPEPHMPHYRAPGPWGLSQPHGPLLEQPLEQPLEPLEPLSVCSGDERAFDTCITNCPFYFDVFFFLVS